jgi:hypothetical protein
MSFVNTLKKGLIMLKVVPINMVGSLVSILKKFKLLMEPPI